MYYGPLIWLICSLLIACTVTSYLILGPTVLSATLCYLLILPVEVMSFFATRWMLDVPQNSQGSGIWGTSEWKYCLLLTVDSTVVKFQLPFLPQAVLWPQRWPKK